MFVWLYSGLDVANRQPGHTLTQSWRAVGERPRVGAVRRVASFMFCPCPSPASRRSVVRSFSVALLLFACTERSVVT